MAINGSKPYEIDGNKYSFAFQDGKLLGANQIDASGDLVSSADLNAPIFQTEAAQNSIREAYNVNKRNNSWSSKDGDVLSGDQVLQNKYNTLESNFPFFNDQRYAA